MQKSYKFRIYPNKTQKVLLNKTFGCVRYAWNQWVENFNKKDDKIFKNVKQFRDELDWMKEVSFTAIQQKARDFQQFKSQFFNKKRKRKLGQPSFKSRKSRQSYRLSYNKFYIEDNKIRLEKIGLVKIIFDRMIPQCVKFVNVTVSKDKVGDYYVSILVEESIQLKPKTGKEIGIDVGLKHFATFSDGTIVENHKFFSENQTKVKRLQQHLSRKIKGSNHYFDTKRKLAKMYRKIARQRSFFLHNLSTCLVDTYDVIAIEDLNVNSMLKNHKLAKSISDVAWSEFFRQLKYKCSWYGKEFRQVNRFEPTSKKCSICGYYYKDLTLKIREWDCPCCGTHHDRDENAATNILNKSVGVNTELQTWRECKTLEERDSEAILNEVSRKTIFNVL